MRVKKIIDGKYLQHEMSKYQNIQKLPIVYTVPNLDVLSALPYPFEVFEEWNKISAYN